MNNNFNSSNFSNMSCNSFINLLLDLNETELTLFGCIIGFYLSSLTNINQQNSLGNFFELVGQILLTMNAQSININPFAGSNLNERLTKIEKELNELKNKFH